MSTSDIDRRQFLRQFGLSGIALNSLLLADRTQGVVSPMSPHFRPRAKNVIFLFMCGGASHLETFDHKPALKRYAGKTAMEVFGAEELAGFQRRA